jgi:hypothetical protein
MVCKGPDEQWVYFAMRRRPVIFGSDTLKERVFLPQPETGVSL